MSAPVECRTFQVDVAHLESGTWCHTWDKQIGEGDINASYSADTIGLEGRVRKPFRWMNALWIWTGIHSKAGTRGAEAYRLVPGVEEQDAAILKMLGQKESDQLIGLLQSLTEHHR